MQCKKCGYMMSDTDRFCKNCGESVQNVIDSQPVQNVEPIFQSSTPTYQVAGANEKHSVVPIILAIIGGIIVVVIVIVLLLLSLFGKNESNVKYDGINEINTQSSDTKVVGDSKYGYVTVPNNWYQFYDVDGNTSLQYSYASVYIISLNIMDSGHTAKEYASNYMYNKKNDNNVTGVTGATVKIGKNKQYTAYQVYMLYPSDNTYLITYWFEAEDGRVHYMALEGPQSDVKDYLSIPESFSLY